MALTAKRIEKWFKNHNIPYNKRDNNIWAVNKNYDHKKPTLLLNSHHDTVFPNKAYTRDPFKADIIDGKLFGLGSNDAGGSLVSLITLFTHYYEYENPAYNLLMVASAEEEIAGKKFFFSNIGNNHLCIEKKSIERLNLDDLYKGLDATLKKFDINLSIFKKNQDDIQIRTYENGVGETLSCGSASLCVATKFLNQNQSKLKVSSMGGELRFKLDKNGILMSGPASFSYKGNINE